MNFFKTLDKIKKMWYTSSILNIKIKEAFKLEDNMKLIILFDGNPVIQRRLAESIKDKKVYTFDTGKCDEVTELNKLNNVVSNFSQSDKEILLVRYSGKESVIREIGDERPEMIIPLSNKKDSLYYNDNLANTFINLIRLFENEKIEEVIV